MSSLIANPSTALWAVAAADTWQWFPFTMLMVLATLQTIPDDPLEAASLDGAGRWQLFRYIVLPSPAARRRRRAAVVSDDQAVGLHGLSTTGPKALTALSRLTSSECADDADRSMSAPRTAARTDNRLCLAGPRDRA
ncbi:carbohydrate ABC transporter permease [Paraburkholderia youngii]|uniref:carbohydrate ABC transporter permease n=1 Tax=Paraburkholderia youngii TaxID=2782701 RepID=UPI003D1EC434